MPAPAAEETIPPTSGTRERDVFELFADRDRQAAAEHRAKRDAIDAQIRDEAPAWRESKEGVDTLRTLIARAMCCGEDGQAWAFQSGALLGLSQDLNTLWNAVYRDNADETGNLSYDELRTAVWRLARRAEAMYEVCSRYAQAEVAK